MKILELRFKNLNSLYGEWIIDFTDPEYTSSGIFALTGPTGAGKSTILDAICLALYGATPRLGKITKSGNEIMSRQTGECYAEVLFEANAGRYRCHWEQRKARKQADGKLQDQEHQIIDADSEKPIETKKSLVGQVIEEKTGMDFDRFTRSILLAQGGFNTFLTAESEKKSMILEQITGTAIYSDISKKVHEKKRTESEKLTLLQAESSGISLLNEEQEKIIQLEQEEKIKNEKEISKKAAETNNAVQWRLTLNSLQKEIQTLQEEKREIEEKQKEFQTDQKKLELAVKASSLDSLHATLSSLRIQESEDRKRLAMEKVKLPELERLLGIQTDQQHSAEIKVQNLKEDQTSAVPLIKKIRSLDQTLSEQQQTLIELESSCQRETEIIKKNNESRSNELQKKSILETEIKSLDSYLRERIADEWLVGGLAGIEEKSSNLHLLQKQIEKKKTDQSEREKQLKLSLEQLQKEKDRIENLKKNLENAGRDWKSGKDNLELILKERLLREYRAEKESLLRERAYIQTIGKLSDHRSRLEDGKPCPLCGSIEHPYALGNIPEPDEIEKKLESLNKIITQAETQETNNSKMEKAVNEAQILLGQAEKELDDKVHLKTKNEDSLKQIKETLAELISSYESKKNDIKYKLQPLELDIDFSSHESTMRILYERLKLWQMKNQRKGEIEKDSASIDNEIKKLDLLIETHKETLSEKEESKKRLEEKIKDLYEERKRLYGDKNPDSEEEKLSRELQNAEQEEKRIRTQTAEIQQKMAQTQSLTESLEKSLLERKPQLLKMEDDFCKEIKKIDFNDEDHFLKARLPLSERESLSSRAKELERRQTEIQARLNDRKKQWENETSKKVSEQSLEELEKKSAEYEIELKSIRDNIATMKHQLNENRRTRKLLQDKQEMIEVQKKECLRWDMLHELIGSSDGKKYRNFAQGLTFELMISHANRQLNKMSDRYLLIRNDEQPLELDVIDNYQAGEIRSSRNLSGGESFIVSLSLALGLSRMASQKVRVDSLFLDEGFGTLDEEALETALDALSGLQQDNKLIGIISHVSALKERIITRINVTPASGGHSRLNGPGCQKVILL